AKGKEKKQHVKKEEKKHKKNGDEGSSDDENVKQTKDADQRLRHKLSIPKVYELMHSVHGKRRKNEIIEHLNNYGFGGMLHICNWTKIPTFFLDWIVRNFEKDHMWIRLNKREVLPLKEDDVHRVYELPMAGKHINIDLCSDLAIKRLRKELGLDGNYSPYVKVTELERILKTTEQPTAWVKGAICFIIHNILCPTNGSFVSLQYAHILEDPAGVSSYNWCSHVLGYMKEGMQTPEVANPLADFHFLMINYMEKMGKRSPFLTGKYKRPSLRDWDVKMALQDLQKVHDIMGLEHGLTAGVTRLNTTDEGPIVLCFDADTCPLSKAEMHLNHCRACIRIYSRTAETLERRIAEGNAETSRKKDAVLEETNTTKDNPMEVPETVSNKSSSKEKKMEVPETSTRGEDRLNKDKENVRKEECKTEAKKSLRYKSTIKRRKVVSNVEDGQADGQAPQTSMPQTPHSCTQETILKYPQYFDCGEASNAG
ncbi:Ulp1 protease family C-terminal catalytic domain containing protein, partial [Trifolium pratense]